MINVSYLRIPMQMLLEPGFDVDAFAGLPPERADQLWTDYTEEEAWHILLALQFAADNPQFDFAALMPDVGQPNAKIHAFLGKVFASLREAFERRPRPSARA
jgi:hypothetical protein